MNDGRRVAVAMSGGVDSSVAAALLVDAGWDVFGLMLRLWGGTVDRPNRCCSPQDVATARNVAVQLGIPFYVLDAQVPFKRQVVDFFVDGYAQGITPNPCMACNREIRWGFLLQQALAMGATHLATGHYARIVAANGGYRLLRAVDSNKDQSYVLSVMSQEQLSRAILPLGGLTKPEVRQRARSLGLPSAERHESQDLCFVAGDYRDFLRAQARPLPPPGPILDRAGARLGSHAGLADYTIGQRKGLGLSALEPMYVVAKEPATNTLVVGPRSALGREAFQASGVNWISGFPLPQPTDVLVRVRYRARDIPGRVTSLPGGRAQVHLAESLPDVTPGQAAVFYDDEVCLGGGIIDV